MVIVSTRLRRLVVLNAWMNARFGYPDGKTQTFSEIVKHPTLSRWYIKVKPRFLAAIALIRLAAQNRVTQGSPDQDDLDLATLTDPEEPDATWEVKLP